MERRQTIIACYPFYPPHVGGLESHAAQFDEQMAKRGHRLTVFTPRLPRTADQSEVLTSGVHVLRYPAFELIPNWPVPKLWSPVFWHQLRLVVNKAREARSHELKTVLISRTRFFSTSVLALLIAKMSRIRWIHIEHGSDYVQLNALLLRWVARFYDHTFGRLVLRLANTVVANSKASAEFVKKLSNRYATVIYRGVDIKAIDRITAADLVASYKLPIASTVITYAGRLIDGKGVADLLKAFQTLCHTDNSQPTTYSLLIVGDGPRRVDLEKLARKLNIASNVRFLGQKPWQETIAILKSSHVFVNPSHTEGLPSSVIEAVLSGCATVATDVGGTREIGSLHLVPPRSPEKLAQALHQALLKNDPPLDATVRERFSWEAAMRHYEVIFER